MLRIEVMSQPPLTTRRSLTQARRKRARKLSVVGVIGELLITCGVLVFLFLGWQLWLNDLILGSVDNNDAAKLSKTWDASNNFVNDGPVISNQEQDFGEPVVSKAPAEGKTFAVMYVPRFGKDWVREIAEGTDLVNVLNTRRIGHYDNSQMPGEIGNFAVAAHRLTYGAPFKDINLLRAGDKIYVKTEKGYYTYVVRNLEYVDRHGVGVLYRVPQVEGKDPTARLMTIMSCNPVWSTAERLIAYAVFDSWQPVSAGPPAEISSLVNAHG